MPVRIKDKIIAEGRPAFIIAEAGANANSDVNIAFALIDGAKAGGADCIKFQHYRAKRLVTRSAPKYYVDTIKEWQQGAMPRGRQYDEFKLLDKLTAADWKRIKNYCDKKGIIFLSTPFDLEQVDLLETLNVQAYKVASADITYFALLEYIAKKKKTVILSTGASTMNEIRQAVKVLRSSGCSQLCLLHCTLHYPCMPEELNLNAMKILKKQFPSCEIGLSDHSLGIIGPIAAIAMGATIIEKHYTIDKALSGSTDHFMSVDPKELKEMVVSIRATELMKGTAKKAPIRPEKEALLYARRSVISSRDIPKGKIITHDDIIVKRPGTGMPPKDVDKVIGKKARAYIAEDILIKKDMLE